MKAQSIIEALAGTYCCINDWDLTIEESGTSLTSLLGYDSSDIKNYFNNHLLELILPEIRTEIRQKFTDMLSKNGCAEFTFQVQHKDGHILWLLNKCKCITNEDGTQLIYGLLTDITRYRHDYDASNRALEHFRILLSQTENIVFEMDCQKDSIFFSESWNRIFGYTPRTEDFIKNLSSDSNLHPDDIPVLLDQLEILKNGGNYQTMEGRIRKADGSYLWCRIRATAIYDETNTISKIIGMIINIDEEKKTASALLQRAEQDPLTKLFNNGTARNYAEKYLRAFPLGARCALIILDLDNFKQINDQHGHMFGDSVLVNTANEIKKLFRSRDIIARIGGDEFLILMKDVSDHALVKERCQQLVDSIHKLLNKDSLSCNSSCSIGIAFAPIHGVTYDILFQHADQALYTAKKHGKNCYAIYDDSIN